MNCFCETSNKRREELHNIQREINSLQDDLDDLQEKIEEEEEEYKMWLTEDKKIQPLAETEMGKPLVDKQLEHKNSERLDHHREMEALITVVDETGSKEKRRGGGDGAGVLCTKIEKESSGNEVDSVDFAKRIAELRKQIEHPANVCFMPSFFDGEERAKTLSLLSVHPHPIVASSPVETTAQRITSESLVLASTYPEVIESGGTLCHE